MQARLLWMFMFAVTTCTLHGQPGFSLVGEAGIGSAGLPRAFERGGAKEHVLPVISPLVGLSVVRRTTGHFLFSAGAQYFKTGQKLSYKQEGFNVIGRYNSKESEEMIFHRLTFPLMIGYKFNIRTLAMRVWVGYKHVYFLSGQYRHEFHDYEAANANSPVLEKRFDPFSIEDVSQPAKRSSSQATAGLSFLLGNRWSTAVAYSIGSLIRFQESSFSCLDSHQFSRGDVVLTAGYRIADF